MNLPSREELEKEPKSALIDLIYVIGDQIDKLTKRVDQLEEQLKTNSRNSSKPPSKDNSRGKTKDKPSPKSLRKKTGKKAGGQKGHEGSNLQAKQSPDHILNHRLENLSCDCGGEFHTSGYQSRQVLDIPPIAIEATEHRAYTYTCSCCYTNKRADFPSGVTSKVQYGYRLKAFSVYLNNYQFIPYKRLQELFKDLFEVSISTGSLVNFNKNAGASAVIIKEAIKGELLKGKVMHCDETGCYVDNHRHWLHVAGSMDYTYYHIDKKRGSEALERMGMLEQYGGTVIHDFYSSYYKLGEYTHGLCNAHHLRDLTFVYEIKEQPWAERMITILLKAKALKDNALERCIKPGSKGSKEIEQLYRECVESGYKANPEPERKPGQRGRLARGKCLNLVRRFDEHQSSILRFLYNTEIPFDNNLAERDIRMMKVREKISGTFRSLTHPEIFSAIRSVVSTARKQGVSIYQTITKLVEIDRSLVLDLKLPSVAA